MMKTAANRIYGLPTLLCTIKEKTNGLIIFFGLVALVAIYHQTVKGLFSVWLGESGHYTHGIVLIFIVVYILYDEWRKTALKLQIKIRLPAIAAILLLSLIWLLAQIAQIQTVTQIAFILLMATYLIGLFGLRYSGLLVFPILLLLTAVPIWSIFAEPLQVPTAYLVDKLLHLTGYISFREGFLINIPEGTFEVGDRCSGLSYQITSITLSFLYAYLSRARLRGMILFALLGSLVAFISNSIRIYFVVLAGHYTNMQHSLLSDHIWLGWLLFSFSFVAFIIFSNSWFRLSDFDNVKHDSDKKIPKECGFEKKGVLVAVLLVIIAASGPIIFVIHDVMEKPNKYLVVNLPMSFDDWTQKENLYYDWSPVWLQSDISLQSRYANYSGVNVDLFLSYYATQKQGREVVNTKNKAFDEGKWKILKVNHFKQADGNNKVIFIKEIIIQNSVGRQRILWQWYYVGGHRASSNIKAKLFGALSAIQGRTDAAVVIVSSEVEVDLNITRGNMSLFVNDIITQLEYIFDANAVSQSK